MVNQAGIQWDKTNSQAYINGWVSFLKEQNANTIISAASKAKKASRQISLQVQKIVRRMAGKKHLEDVYWVASAALPVRSAIRELAKYFHNQLEVPS